MAVIAPPFVSWQELGDLRLHPQEGRDEVRRKARHTRAKQGQALVPGLGHKPGDAPHSFQPHGTVRHTGSCQDGS